MRDFCSSQLEVYEAETPGWAFWSYKLEDCDDDPSWCFEAAVRRGYLPQTFFSYNDRPTPAPVLGHFYQQISALNLDPSLSSSSQPYASRPTSSTYNSQSASPQDKGYSDGYLTATRFALYGLSKLGFVWQYIYDNIQNGNAGVDPKDDGACQAYREAFLQGLKHGEEQVESIVCALGT
ncbi:Glucan 1,3-beta-glucosidase 3 [Paramarasmius palmivorus]|uniref:Glucan 1,3-beta-glucosidase 3 n=1 Tax=Paramarasmius palmivorus TaxID=297713 RepID=A0AAW0DVU2_9AGAR